MFDVSLRFIIGGVSTNNIPCTKQNHKCNFRITCSMLQKLLATIDIPSIIEFHFPASVDLARYYEVRLRKSNVLHR